MVVGQTPTPLEKVTPLRIPERWKQLVAEEFGSATSIEHVRFFPSKKNQVSLLTLGTTNGPRYVIAKYFVWGECDHEWNVLEQAWAAGLDVPQPIARRENICLLEHVRGSNLRTVAERTPERINGRAIGQWLARFHNRFQRNDVTLLKGDCMPPNFILRDDDTVCGIDFEEAREGDPLDEVIEAATTLLTLPPWPESPAAQGIQHARDLITGWQEARPAATPDLTGLPRQIAASLGSRRAWQPDRADQLHLLAVQLTAMPEIFTTLH